MDKGISSLLTNLFQRYENSIQFFPFFRENMCQAGKKGVAPGWKLSYNLPVKIGAETPIVLEDDSHVYCYD